MKNCIANCSDRPGVTSPGFVTPALSRALCILTLLLGLSVNASPVILLTQQPLKPSLSDALAASILQLATNTSKSWSYNPNNTDLGTNSGVWTWPVNLSCVGYGLVSGYPQVLIAPNEVLHVHHQETTNDLIQFKDTNGIPWIGVVTQAVEAISDLDIYFLSNSAPNSIVIPWVLPSNYTNYLRSHSLVGTSCFWCHKNTQQLEFDTIYSVYDDFASSLSWELDGGFGTWMTIAHNGFGPFGNGLSASSGDSGSPAFCVLSNTPVLLFATTFPGDASGQFVSGDTNWSALASQGLTNGMRILNLSGFKKY